MFRLSVKWAPTGLLTCLALVLGLSSALAEPSVGSVQAIADRDVAASSALHSPRATTWSDIRWDDPPEKITRNTHYWVSNEYRHDLFHDTLKDRGGVYVGLGTDQNYLLAGWARPEIMILMDFDEYVVHLHRVYRVMFERAEDPVELIRLWSKEKPKTVHGWLEEAYGERSDLKKIKRAYDRGRKSVSRRLRKLSRTYPKRKIPTFLTDQEQYSYIRQMWMTGKIICVRGNLLGDRSMMDIAEVVRAKGLSIRVLYLSNAEQYFRYNDVFRRNINILPFDDRSVVLHTLAWGCYGFADGHYHYSWQTGANFQAWMTDSKVRLLGHLLHNRTRTRIQGYSFMTMLPAEVRERKAKKRRWRKAAERRKRRAERRKARAARRL